MTPVDWAAAQEALRDMVVRLTTMMRTIVVPSGSALGEWNLTDVAMHLSQAWVVVPGMARRDLSRVLEVLPGMDRKPGGSYRRRMGARRHDQAGGGDRCRA